MNKITQEELKELVEYKEGGLYWLVKRKGRKGKVGEEVGYINSIGYKMVMLNLIPYYLHRLVWLYHYGYFPENNIDHINRDRGDNRIENLREVSLSCNSRNSSIRSDNVSKIKGVYPHKYTGKWEVSIGSTYLGIFENLLDAALCRYNAELKLNWIDCDSSSSAYLYLKENNAI